VRAEARAADAVRPDGRLVAAVRGARTVEGDFLALSSDLLSAGGAGGTGDVDSEEAMLAAALGDALSLSGSGATHDAGPGVAGAGSGGGEGVSADAGDEDGGDDDDDRIARLRELAADDGAAGGGADGLLLSSLTPAERAAFMRAAASGSLSRAFEGWQPWWTAAPGEHEVAVGATAARGRIVEVGAEGAAVKDAPTRGMAAQVPAQPPCVAVRGTPLAGFGRRGAVSPLVAHNLVAVLYVYAHLQKLYVGDWSWEPATVAAGVMAACDVLARDARHETVALACQCAAAACQDAALRLTPAPSAVAAVAGFADVAALLALRHYTVDALSHLEALLTTTGEAAAGLKAGWMARWVADAAACPDALLDATRRSVAAYAAACQHPTATAAAPPR